MSRNSVRHKWFAAHRTVSEFWIDREFHHRVDIGALGTVIVRLIGELEAARKDLRSSVGRRNLSNKRETFRPVPVKVA